MDEINKRKSTQRHTLETFQKAAEKVHGVGTYIYIYFIYVNNKTPGDILCPKHGIFRQRPDNHLHGVGCPECRKEKLHLKNLEERFLNFLKKCKKKFGDKFIYVKETFQGFEYQMEIICPFHGRYTQTPNAHLQSKYGCPECAKDGIDNSLPKKRKEVNEYERQATLVHDGKYIYQGDYAGKDKPIHLICPIHGEFEQLAGNHLKGHGCPKCSGMHNHTEEEWNEMAEMSHPYDDYDLSNTHYKNNKTEVEIGCRIHGSFTILPQNFLRGQGCPQCGIIKRTLGLCLTKEDFVEKARKVYGNKYDYSQFIYINNHTKGIIICPIHGAFLMTPANHLLGEGCPGCAPKSKLEEYIQKLLEENKIEYIHNHHTEWLGRQHLDFYLPEYNVAIECQGIQHFKPSAFHNSVDKEENFQKTLKYDKTKRDLCEENELPLIYFTNVGLDEYPYEVIENDEELLNEIKKYGKNT